MRKDISIQIKGRPVVFFLYEQDNFLTFLCVHSENGCTLLCDAAKRGQTHSCLESLIETRASVGVSDKVTLVLKKVLEVGDQAVSPSALCLSDECF